jgi:hypothetical protein
LQFDGLVARNGRDNFFERDFEEAIGIVSADLQFLCDWLRHAS